MKKRTIIKIVVIIIVAGLLYLFNEDVMDWMIQFIFSFIRKKFLILILKQILKFVKKRIYVLIKKLYIEIHYEVRITYAIRIGQTLITVQMFIIFLLILLADCPAQSKDWQFSLFSFL